MNNNGGETPSQPPPILIVQTPAAQAAAARFLPQYRTLFDLGVAAPNVADYVNECAGEDIAIWPVNTPIKIARADTLGRCLVEIARRVRVIRPNGKTPAGWDLADGQSTAELLDYARAHAEAINLPPQREMPPWGADEIDSAGLGNAPYPEPEAPARTRTFHVEQPTTVEDGASCIALWAAWGLERKGNGEPYANLSNACKCLRNDERTANRMWYDSFHQRVFTNMSDGARLVNRREWTGDDDLRLTDYLQTILGLVKLTSHQVAEAVRKTAIEDTRNEPRDWLESLSWDGNDRLAHLMSDGFGAANTEYTQAVGRCWIMSMVARIMRPGCIAKALPVLEGAENIGKSRACAVIGGPFFAEVHESVASKDFYQAIAGKMLVEIGELHAFKRADIERIKAVISSTNDRYRASYGRYAEDHPRQCVFVGTTNRTDWNASDTGACRFWPITCGEIDISWLALHRDSLFAEALRRYQNNESWWDVPPSDAQREQDARIDRDVWEELVMGYAAQHSEVTVADVLRFAIEKRAADINRADQMRVSSIFRINGWRLLKTKRSGSDARLWRNPVAPTPSQQRLPQSDQRRPPGDDDAPW